MYKDPAVFFARQKVELIINVTEEEGFETPYSIVQQTPMTLRLSVLDKNSEAAGRTACFDRPDPLLRQQKQARPSALSTWSAALSYCSCCIRQKTPQG